MLLEHLKFLFFFIYLILFINLWLYVIVYTNLDDIDFETIEYFSIMYCLMKLNFATLKSLKVLLIHLKKYKKEFSLLGI